MSTFDSRDNREEKKEEGGEKRCPTAPEKSHSDRVTLTLAQRLDGGSILRLKLRSRWDVVVGRLV